MFYGAQYLVRPIESNFSGATNLEQYAIDNVRKYISNNIEVTKHESHRGVEYRADYFIMDKQTMYDRLRELKATLDTESFDKVMKYLIKD